MSLRDLLTLPFNAGRLAIIERQLAKAAYERGMLGDNPTLAAGLDDRIKQLMRKQARLRNSALVSIPLEFVCHTCQVQHKENVTPDRLVGAYTEWQAKHPMPEHFAESHLYQRSEVRSGFNDEVYGQLGRGPFWLNYAPNTNIKIAYGGSATLTFSINSLAASSALVIGRESTAVDNSSDLYIDIAIKADNKQSNTNANAGYFQYWAYGSVAGTPAYPLALTGSDAAATLVAETKATLNFWKDILCVATTNTVYNRVGGLAAAFDYAMPRNWGMWFTNSAQTTTFTTAAAGNTVTYNPIYFTG